MGLAVLFIGTANAATLRALPHGLRVLESSAADAGAVAARISDERLLIIEPEARVAPKTVVAAEQIDPEGGLVGGCIVDGGMLRFGSVFSAVPFGPYEMEPFPLVDVSGGAQNARPPADAIDVIVPGLALVDRRTFVEQVAGLDPALEAPWRAYDLSLRFREAGKPVRWSPLLAFALEGGLTHPSGAVDHHEFMRRWGGRLGSRYDLELPARGGIRRQLRLPLGQREAVTIPLPPVDVIVYGEGNLGAGAVRASTRVRTNNVSDARGAASRGLAALRGALHARSDRYLVLLEASHEPEGLWLERMLVESERAANVCAVREPGRTLLSLSRIPLDVQPSGSAQSVDDAIDQVLRGAQDRARIVCGRVAPQLARSARRVPVSVVLVAQSQRQYGRTSFEGIYAGDLGVDYYAVATPARPEMLEFLKGYPTIQRIVDDTRTMAAGINTALARAQGEIVVIIGDQFFPPRGWVEMVRGEFAVRPETGILGFSTVAVDGPQCIDVAYSDIKMFNTYSAWRRQTMWREAHLAPRLTTLAFAIDARALRAVGGLDERLGGGRYGVEDLTLRVRAAGYEAYASQDIFAHHFPPSESEPYLCDPQEEARRAKIFAEKWGLRPEDVGSFNPAPYVSRGFDPSRDFVPLHDAPESGNKGLRERYRAMFVAVCAGKDDLEPVASALRRYFQAFTASDEVAFAIGVGDELSVETVGARARALLRKTKLALDEAPDVVISALGDNPNAWVEGLAGGPRYCVYDGGALPALSRLEDLSPSSFRRALASVLA